METLLLFIILCGFILVAQRLNEASKNHFKQNRFQGESNEVYRSR